MRVRWTTTAANDLAHIVHSIRKANADAAQRVARTAATSGPRNLAGFLTLAGRVWLRKPAS